MLTLLKPGQDLLIVEKDQSAPHYVLPPQGMSQLEWMTSLAKAVAVVRVESLVPSVTPEGDWVTTAVTARVEGILKKPEEAALSDGDELTLESDGGETKIGGTTVKALLPWRRELEDGGRYVVFLSTDLSSGAWKTDFTTAYQVDAPNGKIRGMATKPVVAGEAAIHLDAAIARIRAAAGNPKF